MLQYRREIDGLRGIAVLAVILFHAGFPHVSGGYLGVDIFFVISGYLITSIILEDLSKNRFRLRDFYERRIRRIIPVLLFVLLVASSIAVIRLSPMQLEEFARSMIGIPIFLANFHFWKTSGYFDASSETNPLLHTWSLSVEEQFYLIFPLLLMYAMRRSRMYAAAMVLILTIASFLSSWAGFIADPMARFYLLPARAWELGVGAFLAFLPAVKMKTQVDEVLSVAGIMLITGSLVFLRPSAGSSPLALLSAVSGAMLVLRHAVKGTLSSQMLSIPPLVFFGLVSFSAYLWHQPVFVFYRIAFMRDMAAVDSMILIALTFVLSYFTWRWIERPFLNRRLVSSRMVYGVVGSISLGLLIFSVYLKEADGLPERFSLPASVSESFVRSDREEECFDIKPLHGLEYPVCNLGTITEPADFVVFGDSHSLSLLDAFDSAARLEYSHGLYFGQSGCLPFLGVYSLRSEQHQGDCLEANKKVFEIVQKRKIPKLILAARWSYYTEGDYSERGISYISSRPDGERSREESRAAFLSGLRTTIREYLALGTKLTIVLQVPQQRIDPRDAYYQSAAGQMNDENVESVIRRYSVHLSDFEKLQAFSKEAVLDHADTVSILDLSSSLCDDTDICLIGTPHVSYYYDDDHLSLEGAAKVIPRLRQLVKANP